MVTDQGAEGKYESPATGTRATLTERRRAPGSLDPVVGPRRRDPSLHAGAFASHQEQPRADRRTGRRQDRHRGRARASGSSIGDVPRRRLQGVRGSWRSTSAQLHRRREVPRRVRGAPQGRPPKEVAAADGAIILFIDETPHRRRRRAGRWRGGGMDAGNLLKPAAGAGRAPVHRRDDARRVPEAHREGRRARAPVPAGGACAQPSVEDTIAILRGLKPRYEAAPRRPASATTRSWNAARSRIGTSRPVSSRTRRSTSSTRPRRSSKMEITTQAHRSGRNRSRDLEAQMERCR